MTLSLLAFDTATEQMSVGLQVGARQFVLDAPGGAQASATLLPAIMNLLAQAGIGLADLDAVAYGRGPGAFTGLRAACAVAQGLAFGAAKPVLPIDTLAAVAEAARRDAAPEADALDVWVAMDARMNEVYAARYRWAQARWSVRVAPMLIGPQALAALWQADPPQLVAGHALTAHADWLRPGAAHVQPRALPDARALLAVAERLWHAGAAVDAAQALPLYLRDKVAQTSAERAAAKAAGPPAHVGIQP